VARRIAILGWGSLLWDGGDDFDSQHGPWHADGPLLRLEFSRISRSGNGRLTLVIDPHNGAPTPVAYCLSRRSAVEDAIEDLRRREKTTVANIGYICRAAGTCRYRDKESYDKVVAWADEKGFDAAVWTDLASNFEAITHQSFSVAAALAYLKGLREPEWRAAFEYLDRAPGFVRTPLRDAFRKCRADMLKDAR
jgi:hypothetical protein